MLLISIAAAVIHRIGWVADKTGCVSAQLGQAMAPPLFSDPNKSEPMYEAVYMPRMMSHKKKKKKEKRH